MPGRRSPWSSTKTFTCSAVALALLAVHLGRLRDLSTANGARLLKALDALPDHVAAILEREDEIARLADVLPGCRARLLSSAAPPAMPSPWKGR